MIGEKHVSPEDFVRKWMEAAKNGYNQRWIAEELDIEPSTVGLRAKRYRARGVKLPALTPHIQTINPAILNKIVDEAE